MESSAELSQDLDGFSEITDTATHFPGKSQLPKSVSKAAAPAGTTVSQIVDWYNLGTPKAAAPAPRDGEKFFTPDSMDLLGIQGPESKPNLAGGDAYCPPAGQGAVPGFRGTAGGDA